MLTRRILTALCAFGLFAIAGDGGAQQKKKADVEEQLVVPPERVGDPQAKLAGKTPWTLESALTAYERFPDDIYLRYVVVQLAKDAKPRQKAQAVERLRTILRAGGGHQVDAFSLFSGTHAVQESLQLDALLPAVGIEANEIENGGGIFNAVKETVEEKKDDDAKPDKDAPKKETAKPVKESAVPLKDLQGPGTQSHPWKKMLADKKPAVSPMSRLVPADAWFVEVRSPGKALALLEQSGEWMGYLATQTFADASDSRLTERLLRQLLLDLDPKKAADFDRAIGAVALTGSDHYLGSGSDVTILVEVKDAELFRGLVGPSSEQSVKHAFKTDLSATVGKHNGVAYRGVTAPDRSVHVFIAEPRPGLHVRSNSVPGLKRVLDAIAGKTPNLGDTEECRYVRTLMPVGAREEDVFVYLSDPFLRRMTGAQVRLVERRRAIGLSHLRLITHAAELYATQYGKRPASLRDIEKSGLAPIFNVGPMASPFGGAYSLSADGLVGVCSILGTADLLTPIAELPHSDATPLEAKLYRDFVKEYSEYWKTYFDPIVCRVQVGPEKLRAETLILPLIDDTVYKGLAEWLGGPKGEAVRLDPLPTPNKNLFTVNLQFNKVKMIQELKKQERAGLDGVGGIFSAARLRGEGGAFRVDRRAQGGAGADRQARPERVRTHARPDAAAFDRPPRSRSRRPARAALLRSTDHVRPRIPALHRRPLPHLCSARGPVEPMIGLGMVGGLPVGFLVSSFVSPVYLSIGVADPKVVDEYFEELDAIVRKYGYLLRHREMGMVISADPHVVVTNGGHRVRAFSIRYGPFRWRTYLGRIGNGLFITNQTEVIDDLHRAEQAKRPDRDLGPEGHGMIRMRPANWNRALAGFRYTWAENLRDSTMNDLHRLENVSRAHAAELTGTPAEKATKLLDLAERIDGLRYRCPQGGAYMLEPDGITWRSSLCGTLDSPEQREAPAETSGIATLMRQFQDLTATVTFLPEGLRAVVTIDRKTK